MTQTKSLGKESNDSLRSALRRLTEELGGQEALADAMGVAQGYLSEVLSGKRGGGGKILRGLGRIRPELLPGILGVTGPAELPAVDPGAEAMAISVLRKRGWTDEEIAAGRSRATAPAARDARDGVALADAWELPLLGPRGRREPPPAKQRVRPPKRQRRSSRPGAR